MANDIFLKFSRQIINQFNMDNSGNDPPSSGPPDGLIGTLHDDPSSKIDSPLDSSRSVDDLGAKSDFSREKALGHQGAKNTGGSFPNLRVLECAQMSDSMDYETVYEKFRSFGIIQRIKMVFKRSCSMYDTYITFSDNLEATSAYNYLSENASGFCRRYKLISVSNLQDDAFDFIPDQFVTVQERDERVLPLPT